MMGVLVHRASQAALWEAAMLTIPAAQSVLVGPSAAASGGGGVIEQPGVVSRCPGEESLDGRPGAFGRSASVVAGVTTSAHDGGLGLYAAAGQWQVQTQDLNITGLLDVVPSV